MERLALLSVIRLEFWKRWLIFDLNCLQGDYLIVRFVEARVEKRYNTMKNLNPLEIFRRKCYIYVTVRLGLWGPRYLAVYSLTDLMILGKKVNNSRLININRLILISGSAIILLTIITILRKFHHVTKMQIRKYLYIIVGMILWQTL